MTANSPTQRKFDGRPPPQKPEHAMNRSPLSTLVHEAGDLTGHPSYRPVVHGGVFFTGMDGVKAKQSFSLRRKAPKMHPHLAVLLLITAQAYAQLALPALALAPYAETVEVSEHGTIKITKRKNRRVNTGLA